MTKLLRLLEDDTAALSCSSKMRPLTPAGCLLVSMPMKISSDRLTFFRVARFSCALSFGAMAGFIASIQEITPGFHVGFSAGTLVAFVLGAIAGWVFWKMAWDARSSHADSNLKWKFIFWGLLFAGFTIGSFLYGLRGHSQERLADFAVGTVTAIIFLTIGVAMFYLVAKHFNHDEPK